MIGQPRDHGGGLDAAVAEFGGNRDDWLDLSTGINPVPYPIHGLTPKDWTALPDQAALASLVKAAQDLWQVPDGAEVLAAPGASALIACLPRLKSPDRVQIEPRTYNEHAAGFRAAGWRVSKKPQATRVIVHPNNPDGQLWNGVGAPEQADRLLVLDESFCDVAPDRSHIQLANQPGVVILKSFGKFWGLAGMRLGFTIGRPETLAPLRDMLGPWPVAGPALRIGARALTDLEWAANTRTRLAHDAVLLDRLMAKAGFPQVGGTSLFRLFDVGNADQIYRHLAQHHILSRTFPYSDTWLRLGVPAIDTDRARLTTALAAMP